MSNSHIKAQWRLRLLQSRKLMSFPEWNQKSLRICQNLLTSSLFVDAKTVLAYFSFRNEPDLSSLFLTNKIWGFPRVVEDALFWHIWTPGDVVNTGVYGIKEPLAEAAKIPPSTVDLILIPCVGCDYRGYRLGYGGGYYDRLLSSPQWVAKPTVGIVFSQAFLPHLPIDSWDKPLQAICTENEWKDFYKVF